MGETKIYEIGFRTASILNARWHWTQRARYIRESRRFAEIGWRCCLGAWRPKLPCTVRLTRIAPRQLDGDNNQGSLKGVRDAIAKLIGVDDADPRVTWCYDQERGKPRKYAVRVEIEEEGT